MYKTGDYGIRGRDGRIVFQGRVDRQVKIPGFRVELPGVEQAILAGPADEGISQCAAIAIHGTLVAFVALDNNHPDRDEERIARLRARLTGTLLPSWVPQVILPLADGFPRTTNDKADTRALEAAYASRMASHRRSSVDTLASASTARTGSSSSTSSTSGEEDGSHIKDELAAEWRRVLQLAHNAPIKDSDNFISLGGHSVLVMLLATRLSARFRVGITVRHLLPAPSFGDQVELV
jgi:aryl carrier-like protein